MAFSNGPYRLAISMAHKSEYEQYRVGAVIARGSRILSTGVNQIKSHPLLLQFDNEFMMGLHAEAAAVNGMDKNRLHRANIYVVRLRRDGDLAPAKPCPTCEIYLRSLGIRKSYFSIDNKTWGEMTF